MSITKKKEKIHMYKKIEKIWVCVKIK
jgi:hypothetical protein